MNLRVQRYTVYRAVGSGAPDRNKHRPLLEEGLEEGTVNPSFSVHSLRVRYLSTGSRGKIALTNESTLKPLASTIYR